MTCYEHLCYWKSRGLIVHINRLFIDCFNFKKTWPVFSSSLGLCRAHIPIPVSITEKACPQMTTRRAGATILDACYFTDYNPNLQLHAHTWQTFSTEFCFVMHYPQWIRERSVAVIQKRKDHVRNLTPMALWWSALTWLKGEISGLEEGNSSG